MKKNNQSYNQIVKSTSIFGGSQIVTILIGIVRTKIIAILLGTTGVGLIGIYQSIIEMIRTTSVLGMDTGGVKEIATAEEAEDKTVLQKSVSVLTRIVDLFQSFCDANYCYSSIQVQFFQ